MKDLRFVKTEEAIRTAFSELIQTIDFEKITIRMICDRARIAKGTFYLHYEDKYLLVRTLFNESSSQMEEMVQKILTKHVDSKERFDLERDTELLRIILDNKKLFGNIEINGVTFDDVVRNAVMKINRAKFTERGFTEQEAELMAWQSATTVLDYCEYVLKNGDTISMKDYWKSFYSIMKLTENAYLAE